ncbi:AMP-binding protein [Marinimicrobium sp. ABcell2]|uniref:AMP-binding protein n=1 Tax=Marinimicrobium sp. ABcell2 TaxID=3069751 RepID=UPI0027B47889|nr:AMP-binding protein [Marinimicrobium sp. ABcell2]MDQ2076974.1 AMP-binding protein [Marinimicrobium sp. ABcell2]
MTPSIDLRQHCLAGGPQPVALSAHGSFSRDQLRERASTLGQALAARPEQRWGIWYQDAWDFLCGFMALALAGKQIVMPHNMQAGTAHQLARAFDVLLTDAPLPELAKTQLTPDRLIQGPRSDLPSPDTSIELVLFTSGSTGEPQPVHKTLVLLESELATLQRCFGDQMGKASVISTVSHQHIYGLLHSVLWPWWRGAPFVVAPCQYPEELVKRLAEWQPATLVSSPTHLSRLPQAPAFQAQPGGLAEIVSSGGPLAEQYALAMAELTGRAPLEILGSTETGGVAWRRRTEGDRWEPLPGVAISLSSQGCLRVNSPHLGSEDSFDMGDRAEVFEDGRFALLGRADRVVKVEGKRLSLTEMQKHLESHPAIASARVTVVRGRREEVGVVATLSREGQTLLDAQGKLALNQRLRRDLLAYFEAPLLPRRWRYVDNLPYNAQGKVTETDLQTLLTGSHR